jgi:hypothetical protein
MAAATLVTMVVAAYYRRAECFGAVALVRSAAPPHPAHPAQGAAQRSASADLRDTAPSFWGALLSSLAPWEAGGISQAGVDAAAVLRRDWVYGVLILGNRLYVKLPEDRALDPEDVLGDAHGVSSRVLSIFLQALCRWVEGRQEEGAAAVGPRAGERSTAGASQKLPPPSPIYPMLASPILPPHPPPWVHPPAPARARYRLRRVHLALSSPGTATALRRYRLPDVHLALNFHDGALSPTPGRTPALPVLSWVGSPAHADIPVPYPLTFRGREPPGADLELEPWERREARAVWRGSTTGERPPRGPRTGARRARRGLLPALAQAREGGRERAPAWLRPQRSACVLRWRRSSAG